MLQRTITSNHKPLVHSTECMPEDLKGVARLPKALEGHWRQELIFVLQQEIEMYDTYQRRIAECDQELQKHLTRFADTVPPQAKEEVPKKKKDKQNKDNPYFHLAD
jgi:transposase